MKRITLTLLALLSVVLLFAQSPQSFKYQSVARNLAGDIIADQNVSFRISILEGSVGGTATYTETHTELTNQFGLVNLKIGSGIVVTGTFANITWGSNSYFLQIEMDATGGSTYQLMGTSQLLSVPYALFSENTANPDDGDWTISGSDMFSGVTGNVGIGTSTPDTKLEVAGHISIVNTGESVFLGENAGANDNMDANENVFIGYESGTSNISGFGNTAVGSSALDLISTGNTNTAIGYGAGPASSSANVSGCVFIGPNAGYWEDEDNKLHIQGNVIHPPLIYGEFDNEILAINGKLGIGTNTPSAVLEVAGHISVVNTGESVFLGENAGANDNMDANENVFIGYESGTSNISGFGNTAVGSSALDLISTGNTNTAIGYGAGPASSSANVSGCVFIGPNAGYWEDEDNKLHIQGNVIHPPLIYGEFDNEILAVNGKLGIGETAPNSQLHINNNTGENALRVQIAGVTKMIVASNGSTSLFNASSPTFALNLQNSSADLSGRGRAFSWNTYSDNRLKSNQRELEYGLNEVMQLHPKSYDHHSSSTSEEGEFIMVTNQKEATIGFIAQEVEKIIPEAVNVPKDDSQDLWSMDYSKIIPVLTKAIQDQQEIIEEQQVMMEELLFKIERLENK